MGLPAAGVYYVDGDIPGLDLGTQLRGGACARAGGLERVKLWWRSGALFHLDRMGLPSAWILKKLREKEKNIFLNVTYTFEVPLALSQFSLELIWAV